MNILSLKSIRAKAALYVLFLLTLTTAVSYLITVRVLNVHIMGEIIQRAESLSRSIASASGYSLLSQDLLGLDNLVYKIRRSNPDINYIAIVGPGRKVIVHSDVRRAGSMMQRAGGWLLFKRGDGTMIREVPSTFDPYYEIESPIAFMDKRLGSVVLSINRSILFDAQAEARRKVIGLFAVILALGMVSSLVLSSRLTRPIQELAAGVEELKHGKRNKPLRVYSSDELGRLTASFNEMTGLITEQQDRLGKYAQDLEEAYVSTIRVLAAAIDARDHYTLGHSTRVSELAVGLGGELGMTAEAIEEIEIACLFHDVGKIKIRDSILHKRGPLSRAERQEMRKHPVFGAEILVKAPSLYRYIPAVRHHHEWYDGTGYPDGLSREQIPPAAAVVSLADAFDAMTSDRPYRTAMTPAEALKAIGELAGRQFNPELAQAFQAFIEKQKKEAGLAPAEG